MNWKKKEQEHDNALVRDKNDPNETHVAGRAHQSFESTFKSFLKSHYPRCAGQRQVN